MIEFDGIVIEVIKVKGGWAQKATVDGVSRYRLYHYKKEAVAGLQEWMNYNTRFLFEREFHHNFHSAEELGVRWVWCDEERRNKAVNDHRPLC